MIVVMAPKIADKTAPNSEEKSAAKKKVSLALQGGGSHGAYTWGVVDALLEDDRLEIEGVCGTSAGGMLASSIVQGLVKDGNRGARKSMNQYWTMFGDIGKTSPIQFNPYDKAMKNFTITNNPLLRTMMILTGIFSPYQLNPLNVNPLRDFVEKFFDFDLLQSAKKYKLFLCATHVATGKLKVFTGEEISLETILASACIPSIFQAIEHDGEYYWDGGYIGNPAIFPLIYYCDTPDIIVIQIRRVYDPKLPTTGFAINNRLAEITQNTCLTREMRAIAFITKLIDDGIIQRGKLKRLYMHMIRDDMFVGSLEQVSGYVVDPDFLKYLYDAGRRFGRNWLKHNFDSIGVKTTARIEEDYI
jgi:NTE family protein